VQSGIPQWWTVGVGFRGALTRAGRITSACAVFGERVSLATVPRSAPSPALRKPPRARRAASDDSGSEGRSDNVSRAYRDLRSVIVWGQLPPGSRISERVLAERLGLSRTPVRSALHRLEQEGFIASSGRGRERRLIVAPLTMDDGQELFRIVGHLEGLAARTAAGLPPARRKEIAARMRELNRELASQSRTRGAAARFFELDLHFHAAFVENVAGPRLVTLHRAIKPQCERYTRLYVSVLLDELPTSVKEHEVIASSIVRGDPDAAQEAVETNWNNAAIRLARIISQHGERGSWAGASRDEVAPEPRSRAHKG
jgi:DNA-binding GntR family transcriptional regulator